MDWHASSIENAVSEGKIPQLRAAIKAAQSSELGPGHPIVEQAKQKLEGIVKERKKQRHQEVLFSNGSGAAEAPFADGIVSLQGAGHGGYC